MIHEITKKPILICDHQCSFPTEKYRYTMWQQLDNQTGVAKKHSEYIMDAVNEPYLIGYHRCQYIDRYETINGNTIPPVREMLNTIDWASFAKSSIPARFHGDLHFENILISETGNFTLLDWRQDFAGMTDFGDLYYDLAKLLHGMIVSHRLVNQGLFSIVEVDDVIEFDLHRKHTLIENEI